MEGGDISPLTAAASLGDFWIEALKHAGLAACVLVNTVILEAKCETKQL